jgi:hypothetical protein
MALSHEHQAVTVKMDRGIVPHLAKKYTDLMNKKMP